MCRACRERFHPKEQEEGKTWIMPSRNWYYHKTCYEDWRESKEDTESNWIDLIYDLIARDLKGAYNWHQIESQRKKFTKQNMTNKGIYFTLYWYFYIQKREWKPAFGIGIVPSIYQQATAYWVDKTQKQYDILDQIEELAKERKKGKVSVGQPRRERRNQRKAVMPD